MMVERKRVVVVGGVILLLLLLLAQTSTTLAARSAGCAGSFAPRGEMGGRLVPGRSTTHSFIHDGIQRDWVVHLPKRYMREHAHEKNFKGHPLVLSLHGWCSNASQDETLTGFSGVADKENFIVVYPQGIGDRTGRPRRGCRSWNCVGSTQSPGPLGETCEPYLESNYCYDSCNCKKAPGWLNQCNWTTCANDITPTGIGKDTTGAFLPRLLDLLEDSLCIDTSREYVTGLSNGGMMAYQMGITLSRRIAAIAPIAATFPWGFLDTPDDPVALLSLNGLADSEIPAHNTTQPFALARKGWRWHPTAEVSAAWSAANGCIAPVIFEPRSHKTSVGSRHGLDCHYFGKCNAKNGGASVVRCTWNGHHLYLGSSPMTSMTTHGNFIWEFLSKYSKPSHIGKNKSAYDATYFGTVRIDAASAMESSNDDTSFVNEDL